MADTDPIDVFVSYARADLRSDNPRRRSLPAVVQALRDRGLRVFLDTSDIDGFVSLNATLTSAIERSRHLLAWYSPTYPTRPACRAELTLALIAARIASTDRPVVLAVNTEADAGHILHAPILGHNFLSSPAGDDAVAVAALAAKIAEAVHADDRPIGLVEKKAPRWYPSRVTGSSRFVGRLNEIWELDASLWPHLGSLNTGVLHDGVGSATCLVGLGGSGKTLLVLEYARQLAPAFAGGVFWLPAGGRDDPTADQLEARRESAFRQIASALTPPISTERLSFDQVRAEIGARIAADGHSCLWIVDDLPAGLEQSALELWLGPPSSRTVITTRSTEYDFLPNVRLGPMDTLDALELLTKDNLPAAGEEREAAEAIVRALEGHPMGLDIANAYLLHRPSYREFVERLKGDAGADVLERGGELSQNKSIQVVMLESFSLLNADGLAALRIACAVPPLPLPESLMRSVADRGTGLGKHDIESGVAALLNLSLARRTEPGVIQLHSLVNRTSRLLEPESVERLRPVVAASLFHELDGVTLERVAGVRHEARLAREFSGEPKTLPDLWVNRAALLADTFVGAFQSSLSGWQAQVRAADAIAGTASWEATIARCYLSEVLRELGDCDKALSVGEEALYWSERSHGWEDWHTIIAAEPVALALASVARRDEAIALFKRIRSAYDAHGSQCEAGVARALANLCALGAGEGLTALLTDSVCRADTDQETLRTVVQLAPLEIQAGQPKVAVRLLSQCLVRLLAMVGSDHPLTCACKVGLAQAHAALEEYSEAEELLQGALAWYEKELGNGHSTTVTTRNQLTSVRERRGDPQVRQAVEAASAANRESVRLFNAGQRQAALEKAEEALSLSRDLFGFRSSETFTDLQNVAYIAGELDIDRAATALYELCQLLGKDDERRKSELDLLALAADRAAAAARAKGDSAAACRWVERSLQALDELTGPRSDEAVKAAWNLCMLLDENGRRNEALAVLIDRVSHLLAADESTLSPDLQLIRDVAGIKTRDSRTRSGALHNERQMSDEAMRSAADRANAMTDIDRPWDALNELQQLADEFARRYGTLHPQTLWINFMLWTAAGRLGQINEDRSVVEQAVEQLRLVSRSQRAQLGEDHPNLLATLQNLASLLWTSDPAEAARLDEQCLDKARRVYGLENPATVMIAINAVNSAVQISNYTGARSILNSYLGWLVEKPAAGVPKELLPARTKAIAIGQRLGIFAS